MRDELRVEARKDVIAGAVFYDRQRKLIASSFTACLFSDLERLETGVGLHRVFAQRAYFSYGAIVLSS